MPISADQSAVLEMLLTGGQSFEELDDLFGLDEGESHERARAALEEMGGANPDRNVGLTEYLLGQADPIGRADAVRHLRQDPDDRELAGAIVTELEEQFPGAELPKLPQAPAGSRFGGRQSAAPTRSAGKPLKEKDEGTGFTSRQTRIFAALAGGAILLIVVVLAIAGVFSGDDEPAPQTSTDEPTAEAPADPTDPSSPIPDGTEVSRIALAPPGGGDAGGGAVVAVTDTGQPYIDLVLSNLPEPPKNQPYLVWFMFDNENGFPLAAAVTPRQDGSFEGRFPIPPESGGILQYATAIEISAADPEEVLKEAEAAFAEESAAIRRPGETALRGEIPPQEGGAPEDQQAPGEGGGEDNG